MNAKITLLGLLAFLCFQPKAAAQCTTGTLYPDATFTPSCTGSNESIVTNAWAGEYTNVNVAADRQYVFSSGVATDYVTIVNPTGNVVLAQGPSPLSWSSGTTSGVMRYFLHTNANCGTQDTNRMRYIQCTVPAVNTCGAPTALAVSNITSNSTRLSWTAPVPAPTSYDLYIITTNTAPVAGSAATATTDSAGAGVLSGLTPSTTYYYWVRSSCGATKGAWVSGGSFTTNAALSCNGASNGLYPEATFTPACTGSYEVIAQDAYAGEFSNVNVLANKQYTFYSNNTSDYITITNNAGTVVLANGVSPILWDSGTTSGTIRYFLHSNANCGVQNTSRVKAVKCVEGPSANCGTPTNLAVSLITSNSVRMSWTAPASSPTYYEVHNITTNTPPTVDTPQGLTTYANGITNLNNLNPGTTYYFWVRSVCGSEKGAWVSGGSYTTHAFASCNGAYYGLYPAATFTPSCTGLAETIANDAYAGEFANVNVQTNKQYTFTSSVSTDYLTITNASGTVLATGQTPLIWNSGATSGTIRYHLHANANCGTQASNRVRSVKCGTVPPACNVPTQLYATNITSNSAKFAWVDPVTMPDNYELYVSTSSAWPAYNQQNVMWVPNSGLNYYGPLDPATNYNFWVRSVCGNTKTDWASGGSFDTLPALQCNGATFGLFPQDYIFLQNTGAPEPVAYQATGASYSYVVVENNRQYQFTSTNTADFITVTDFYGTTVLASGTTPVTWSSANYNGDLVRFYIHADGNCGISDDVRDKYVKSTTLGVDSFAKDSFKVYPNPSAGQFTVETGTRIADSITIFDSLGRIVGTHTPAAATTNLSLSGLTDGIYYVRIGYEGSDVTRKLVLKK